MKKISVVLIVKNEEEMLGRCLDSVAGADEIIICDTGSIDKTVEVARRYTDKVYTDFIWCDDFAAARNYAKSKATGDYILSIDADEYCHDFSKVREAVETMDDDAINVKMVMENVVPESHFYFSRIFKNAPHIFWVGAIHNCLNIGPTRDSEAVITYGSSPAHILDPDRALRILEKEVKKEATPRELYYLGREYWYKQRYKECTATLGYYVQIAHWDPEKADAFLIMARAYSTQGLDEDARDACLQAIKLNPNFREAVMFMASIVPDQHAAQWHRMAETASNVDILFQRVPAESVKTRAIFLAPHNDDEALFGAYTLMRLKPLVIVCTDSFIQPNRGDIGCSAQERRQETINAMNLLGCTVVFLGIKDTELTEDLLKQRLQHFNPDTVYAPAIQNGNPQHDMVGKVALELFGKKVEVYTTYTKTELWTKGNWEIVPTEQEKDLKNKALDCYVSQIRLPSTRPHFIAVRNKSEWLM